jgi:hypothetical protein
MRHENAARLAVALLAPTGGRSHAYIALERCIGSIGMLSLIGEITSELEKHPKTAVLCEELWSCWNG